MSIASILLPCAALAMLSAIVSVCLYVQRIGEMQRRRIAPQMVATSKAAAALLENTRAADNYRNLFELPVLLYVLCLALAVTQLQDAFFVAGAWLFVALRALHSAIHVSYNRVMDRFRAFLASMVVLFVLWAVFSAKLLGL
jgi:hypothetical protein